MNIQDVSLLKIEDDGTNCDDTLIYMTMSLGEVRAIQKFVADAQPNKLAENEDGKDFKFSVGKGAVAVGQSWRRIAGVGCYTPVGYVVTLTEVDSERAYWVYNGTKTSIELKKFVNEFQLVNF